MPKVTLIRGISGAGKSHYAKLLPGVYFSTDMFWERYNLQFDPSRLGEAHAWNFRCFDRQAQEGETDLVVDNTNISPYEISPYILAATAYGYEHEILTIWCDPIIAWRRNQHNVPAQVVLSMYQRLLKEELPSFWKHRVIYPEG